MPDNSSKSNTQSTKITPQQTPPPAPTVKPITPKPQAPPPQEAIKSGEPLRKVKGE